MAETRTTTAESGVRIFYEVEGTGPPVVLLHGITENRRAWDDFMPALRDSFQVIRLDLRGHGESDKGESYGPLELASDVRAVVDALDVGAPHVVGHSLGGMVATVETWDGLGHWLHLVEPERFVARVRSFTATADTSG
ncbi:MAG: alpha/beta fold hydrolase [Deltaproteobacteria bacterium]|nr:alpha/beta fold hydrolase [Deltaproteobacteria bacterium]